MEIVIQNGDWVFEKGLEIFGKEFQYFQEEVQPLQGCENTQSVINFIKV